ncbi:MAG: hypothetical protein P1S60_18615, partial [Anaerolineae bacterium]|nr:hypothetical protein [Anaerolineae bacterium]
MLHIERITQSIDRMATSIGIHNAQMESELTNAMQWLEKEGNPAHLAFRIQSRLEVDNRWEGAIPCTDESPATIHKLEMERPQGLSLIGVDGSQIFPDRHAAFAYCLIQCGA